VRYGALLTALLLLAVGAVFLSDRPELPEASIRSEQTPPASVGRTGAAPVAAGTSTLETDRVEGDDVASVNTLRRDEVVELVAAARSQAAAGNFAAAETALARADKVLPNFPETARARLDIAKLRTPDGQLSLQLQRARLAIDHEDSAAAEAALAEAARIKPDSVQLAQLRADLRAAQDKKARREARIAEALGRMREAVARRDFGAANAALNEAERIDVQDPTIRRARGELARARDSRFDTAD
jgi:uncharacterized protein HemY